jgi:hypothetical protein
MVCNTWNVCAFAVDTPLNQTIVTFKLCFHRKSVATLKTMWRMGDMESKEIGSPTDNQRRPTYMMLVRIKIE